MHAACRPPSARRLCARRSRSGAARRSPTSPTRRSPQSEVAAARGAAARRCSRSGSTPSSSSDATSELVGELDALVKEYPLRERLRGAADARALPLRPAGRGAPGVPGRQAGPRRGARHRARARAQAPAFVHPQPGARSIPSRWRRTAAPHYDELLQAMLAGRLVPVLGGGVNPGGNGKPEHLPHRSDLAAYLADVLRVPTRARRRPDQGGAVRQRDPRRRPALRRAARRLRPRLRARPGAPLPRPPAGAAARARGAAAADRDDELRPRARAGVRGGGRAVRRRLVRLARP